MIEYFLVAVRAKRVMYLAHLPNPPVAPDARFERTDDVPEDVLAVAVLQFLKRFANDDVRLMNEYELFQLDMTGFYRVDSEFGFDWTGPTKMWLSPDG